MEVQGERELSLEKIFLMRILRWNPHWLTEQIGKNDPPPILGDNKFPMTTFHSFNNHNKYIEVFGDLLLMEIWGKLTHTFTSKHNNENILQMTLESMPPVSLSEKCLKLFNITVDLSLPKSDTNSIPRPGDLMLIVFGASETERFFYVHNVKCLYSPPNNIRSFFNISLYGIYTDKLEVLHPGEVMKVKTITYIKNELILIDVIQRLRASPLSMAILNPEPRYFSKLNTIAAPASQWTKSLNSSQLEAVNCSVNAALGDKATIQMVQGPPGTGKSAVICSTVMAYFYDANCKKIQNRGKILICATSNAAVDELVLQLLQFRIKLPSRDRFRMVRVGREDAMHPYARKVSLQNISRAFIEKNSGQGTVKPCNELASLEAKLNMWEMSFQSATDPARAAFIDTKTAEIKLKIQQIRSGCGVRQMKDDMANAENCVLDGADIIVTTLNKAANQNMRVLKGRIALCIIDEAGRAIEPESLIPLTLDVTHVTLIGDTQQLPGVICSQYAKRYGLAVSLFSRLSSCIQTWEVNPIVLLNV